MSEITLPFPRGEYIVCNSATDYDWMVGKRFCVQDTLHGTGRTVELLVVRNISGSAITAGPQLLRFGTGSKDFGKKVSGAPSAAGQLAVPIDDHIPSGTSIPNNAIFYVVLGGPARAQTPASGTVSLAAHDRVVAAASGGRIGLVAATSGQVPLGYIDQATSSNNATVLVHWCINCQVV